MKSTDVLSVTSLYSLLPNSVQPKKSFLLFSRNFWFGGLIRWTDERQKQSKVSDFYKKGEQYREPEKAYKSYQQTAYIITNQSQTFYYETGLRSKGLFHSGSGKTTANKRGPWPLWAHKQEGEMRASRMEAPKATGTGRKGSDESGAAPGESVT